MLSLEQQQRYQHAELVEATKGLQHLAVPKVEGFADCVAGIAGIEIPNRVLLSRGKSSHTLPRATSTGSDLMSRKRRADV